MVRTTSRPPPNRQHLVLRCKYCTRRFIGVTDWRFFTHVRNHERNIKPYWYKNKTASRVELKKHAEESSAAAKVNSKYSGEWKAVSKYASEKPGLLDNIAGGKIPKIVLKRSHESSADIMNGAAPPAKGIRKSLDPITISNSQKRDVPTPSSKNGNNKNPALRHCDENCQSPTTAATNTYKKPKAKSDSSASPKKRYHCQYCPRCFPQNSGLVIHERVHRGDRPFVCDICDKGFYDKTNLRKHRRIHDGTNIYNCQHCSYRCSDGSNLTKHVRKAHQDGPDKVPRYRCTYCDRECSTNTVRLQHERIHTGEKPFSCQFCDKPFTTECDRRRHEMLHTNERPYQCDVAGCTEAFVKRYLLTLHVRRKHTGETPYKCDFCSKSFITFSAQKKHEIQHTTTMMERKRFKCTYCDNLSTTKTGARDHEQSHMDDRDRKMYSCEDCGKQYKGRQGLRNHKQSGRCGIEPTIDEDTQWGRVLNPSIADKIHQKIIADCESNNVRRKSYYSKLITTLCRHFRETKGRSRTDLRLNNKDLRLYYKDVRDALSSMTRDCDKKFTLEYFIPSSAGNPKTSVKSEPSV